MTTPPEDPNLGARMRSEAFVRQGEISLARTWFRAIQAWLDRVRPQVLRDGGVDPSAISNESEFWGRVMTETVIPEVASLLLRVMARMTQRREPVTDPWTADYLNQVGNRLVNVPDQVYAMVVTQIEEGIREGDSIPDLTHNVADILTATGTNLWAHRAVTVARTETMGAVNAGAYRGAVLLSERVGDVNPQKVWLATLDMRVRPTHRSADQQAVALDAQFSVGDSMLMFPGDPRGPAQEVVNCRCTTLHTIEGETLDWTNRGDP